MHAWSGTWISKKNLLVLHPNRRNLRSSMMSYRLIEPFTTRQIFAARSFSVAAQRLLNNLPNSLKDSSSIEHFKKGLRTHLFRNAFNNKNQIACVNTIPSLLYQQVS